MMYQNGKGKSVTRVILPKDNILQNIFQRITIHARQQITNEKYSRRDNKEVLKAFNPAMYFSTHKFDIQQT